MKPALLTCALIAAIEALTRYGILKIPNPPAVALIAVIYAGYSAGLRAGLLSAALAVFYGLYFFSAPGAVLQFEGDNAVRMVVLALAAPFLAWMTGALRDRAVRGVRAVRDSEARYRALSDLSSDWYWEQDENFRFVDFSADVLRAAGSSVGSHIGKTRWELPTVGVSQEDWAKHRAALEAHRPFRDFEFQRVSEAGELIWMSTSGVPVFDDAGRFRGYRGVARNITEKKRAEETVRESEARFRGAFRLGLVGMALTSPTKGLIEVNDALCRMLGYSKEQLVGTTWVQHTHPDDVAANLALLERALAGETDTYGMQKRFLRADGGIVHAEIAASCIRDADGSARFFVLMVQDITERRRAEQALASAKERLQRALEGSRLALWDADLRSGEVYLSEGWAELLGGPAVETRTTVDALTRLVHPDDVERVVRFSTEVAKGTRAEYSIEHRVHTRSGDWKWINSVGKVSERDATGRALRMSGTNRDITARKQAELALQENERRLRLVANAVPAMIVYVDAGLRYRFCNWRYCEAMGRSEAKMLGRTVREVVGEQEYEAARQWLEKALAGEQVEYERRHRWPFGRVSDLSVTYVPHRGNDGMVQGLYAMLVDITERRRAERIKEQFVSMVSHELRTPLTSIIWTLETLAERGAGRLSKEEGGLVSVAQQNAERMLQLADEILEIEQADQGALRMSPRVVSLPELVARALTVNRPVTEKYGVQLGAGALAETQVMADPDRLLQVLSNFISNAAKHSPRGGRIEVGVERREAQARVSVADSGAGVPEEFRTRLFGRFAQSAAGREKGGAGLGLAICKEIVERSGGAIGHHPNPAGGSVFYFDLPAA